MPAEAIFSDLPDALLGKVFALCGRKEGKRLTLVCRRWHAVFYSEPALWHTLPLGPPAYLLRMVRNLDEWTPCKQAVLRRVGGLVMVASMQAENGHTGWTMAEALLPLIQPQLSGLGLKFAPRDNQPYSLMPFGIASTWPEQQQQREADRAAAAVLQALPQRFPSLQQLSLDLADTGGPALPPCTPAVLHQLPLTDLRIASPHSLPAGLLESLLQATALTKLSLASTAPDVPLAPGLAALTALRALRHLELIGCYEEGEDGDGGVAQVPLPADLEGMTWIELAAAEGAWIEIAGATASMVKCWVEEVDGDSRCSLELTHLQADALEPVLAALQLPGWLPDALTLAHTDFPTGAASIQHCGPYLACLGSLHLINCDGAQDWVGQLAAHTPHLSSLKLDTCGMTSLPPLVVSLQGLVLLECLCNQLTHLPPGPYLSRLEGLQLSNNRFASLPAALISAGATLRDLGLAENPPLTASCQQMDALLDGLPALKFLDVGGDTCIDQWVMSHVQEVASARGLQVVPAESAWEDGDGCGHGGYDSSDSDSSDDGCPRYSWAGCAYASHW